jgi:mannose-6-phosphate isomerase-like protein (cupin superfamily)
MNVHDLQEVTAGTPDFTSDDRAASFWMPERFNQGMVWVGRFTGRSPWERHPDSDELLAVRAGEMEFTILGEDGEETRRVPAGSFAVVPRGLWHRVRSTEEVNTWGVTVGATEHSEAEDPREG